MKTPWSKSSQEDRIVSKGIERETEKWEGKQSTEEETEESV